MNATSSWLKTCVLCGENCADRARVRDKRGRYYCRDCHQRAAARAARRRAAESIVEFEIAAAPGVHACPGCGRRLAADAVICCECGFDVRLQQQLITEEHVSPDPAMAPSAPPAPWSPPRPMMRTSHERWMQDAYTSAWRTYATPILMFVIGAGWVFLLTMLRADPEVAGLYLLSYVIQVPIGITALWLCCVLWIGFDAPLHLTALKLAGIYAICDLVSMIPIPLVAWVLATVVYIGLLMQMLDLDLLDAAVVAIMTVLVKIGLVVVIALWMAGLTG